jgi:hypothetical protein
VALACHATPKTPDKIDWQVRSDDTTILRKAKRTFDEELLIRTDLPQKLVNELEAYRAIYPDPAQGDEARSFSTGIPPAWIQFSTDALGLANVMYEALTTIATATCGCSSFPKHHQFEMRLPLLAQLPKRMLRLQIRKQGGEWQHAWIILTSMYGTCYSGSCSYLM